jgi:chromosome partitioning protein
VTTIAFFNNKGGVGKTTLVYHVASMLADLGVEVLAADLDPQANLTAMCLPETRLEELWPDEPDHPQTVLGCVRPILRGLGDVLEPHVEDVDVHFGLLVGDLGLSTFEDKLSDSWPRALDMDEAAFRALSSLHRIMKRAAQARGARVILVDIGPNLGAINRAALLAAEWVVTPLAPDLFSIQGLRNLGPTLRSWRVAWQERLRKNPALELDLPAGRMEPAGYVVMQSGMRLSRPVRAYERWVARIPEEYRRAVVDDARATPAPAPAHGADPFCLAVMRHYHSLMPLAQDAQKPMFRLRPGDGAIGAHMAAVQGCRKDFDALSRKILERCGLGALLTEAQPS